MRVSLIGITVFELAVILVIVSGGVTTLVVTGHQSASTRSAQMTQPPPTEKPQAVASEAPPTDSVASTPSSSSSGAVQQSATSKTSTPSQASTNSTTEEALAEYKQCDSANAATGQTYSAAINQAKAAYDAVMGQWDAVKDQPQYMHPPYDQYAADAKSKYNAISVPAYSNYSTSVNSLKAQGCKVVQAYPDYSWKI